MKVKSKLMQEFKMSDLGNLSYFLGMKFKNNEEGVFLHQTKYAQDILKIFNMSNCNEAVTLLETRAKSKKNTSVEVHGYSDLDFSGDQDENITGYIFIIEGTSIS